MARARNIKPGFFRNAELVELPYEARLLFIGLWTIADRKGRLEDRPKQIKMELFPADNMDCDDLISQLSSIGMVSRYSIDGKNYLQVTNFSKHQNPHKDEKESTIPDQDGIVAAPKEASIKHHASTVQTPCKHDATSEVVGLIPDSLNLNPDPLSKPAQKRRNDYTDDFLTAWDLYPERPGANKSQTFKAWNSRINEGVAVGLMLDGVRRYANYCRVSQTNQNYIKQPATFFGPDHHYESEWIPVAPVVSFQTQKEINTSATLRALGIPRQSLTSFDFIEGGKA